MTEQERARLEGYAIGNPIPSPMSRAILAALAEVDRLHGELAAMIENRNHWAGVADSALDSAAKTFVWIQESPTSPGWYWLRLRPGYGGRDWLPRVVEVARDPRSGRLTEVDRAGSGWEWAGPIAEPIDP